MSSNIRLEHVNNIGVHHSPSLPTRDHLRLRREAAAQRVLGDHSREHELQQVIRPAGLGADAATA